MSFVLPNNTVKFRETSPDSTLFHLPGHTPELPCTLTIQRILPSPRKGNAGTMKILMNYRRTINIGSSDVPKIVPVITKVETSVPVGAGDSALGGLFQYIGEFMKNSDGDSVHRQEIIDLFVTGLLPGGA